MAEDNNYIPVSAEAMRLFHKHIRGGGKSWLQEGLRMDQDYVRVNRKARRLGKRTPKGHPFRRVISAHAAVKWGAKPIGKRLDGPMIVDVYRESDHILVGYHATKGRRVWSRRFVMNEYKRAGVQV